LFIEIQLKRGVGLLDFPLSIFQKVEIYTSFHVTVIIGSISFIVIRQYVIALFSNRNRISNKKLNSTPNIDGRNPGAKEVRLGPV
jgi:hypothetical protein